jgi:hypothetical protein
MCDIHAALSMFAYTFDMLLRVHIQMFGRQAIFNERRCSLRLRDIVP